MGGGPKKGGKKNANSNDYPEIGGFVAMCTYFCYFILTCAGRIRDFFAALFGISRYHSAKLKAGYTVLLQGWEGFFTRRLYHRVQVCSTDIVW